MLGLHPENAQLPISVTEFGIVTDVSPLQFSNAELAMTRVPSFMAIDVFSGIVPLYLYATLPA